MVGYMNLEEQVDADYTRARRRAFLKPLMARLRRDPTPVRLPCFEEVNKSLGAAGGGYLGLSTVRVEQIAGSVGRCSEFDRASLPIGADTEERWKRIDRAFHCGEELPPVSLYEIGGSYFVLDGNHRVSVYRYHGVEWIDAYVTEFRIPVPVEPTRTETGEEPKGAGTKNCPREERTEDGRHHEPTRGGREDRGALGVRG